MENSKKVTNKNLWFYPLGTVGRDGIYQLFNNFILTFILFTKGLTDAQMLVITAIMIGARVFDAINDPIMGVIIEKTKTKFGKFKPWLAIGMALTAAIIIVVFNSTLKGWSFVVLFGVIYFLYSIAYTMHDISYWGMIPALSSDADLRNQFTSRATLFAGFGGALIGMLVPIFTAGENAIGGSTEKAYGVVSIVVVAVAVIFILFTLFGVKEMQTVECPSDPTKVENHEPSGLKAIFTTIKHNKPLRWVILAFLLQQIGNGLIAGGLGSTYVYFEYGYKGGLYSIFSTVGLAATAVLMVLFPVISRKINRKPLMGIMLILAIVGYVLMLLTLVLPAGIKFPVLVVGYMLSNLGQYSYYLIMMISILNTVEYNEYTTGSRNEAIIASVRPFITKLASAIIIGVTSLSYLMFKVSDVTNEINKIEQQFNAGSITNEAKENMIETVIQSINSGQKLGLLLIMVLVSFVLMTIAYFIYKKKYTLDEAEYDKICKELELRRKGSNTEVTAE